VADGRGGAAAAARVAAVRAALPPLHFCNMLARYGWFTGLMLCGSCFGAVTWGAWMQVLTYEFRGGRGEFTPLDRSFFFWSLSDRWNSGFRLTYASEFLCLSVAKLIVLDRMSIFAAGDVMSRRWLVARRLVLASVISGNLAGLAANVATAVSYYQRADLLMIVSVDLAANSQINYTSTDYPKFDQVADELQRAFQISSIQPFCEVAVLMIIILAFVVVGVACVRRIGSLFSMLHTLSPPHGGAAIALGSQMRREMIVTTTVVFVAFVIRSVYSTMFAVAFSLQNFSKISRECQGFSVCDASCFNEFTHMLFWMIRTPELQLVIMLISNPLPLIVALWQMTSVRMRQAYQRDQHEEEKKYGLERVGLQHSPS
jgi:hypothetical protein